MVTYPKDWKEKTFNAFLKIKRGASPRPIESYCIILCRIRNQNIFLF